MFQNKRGGNGLQKPDEVNGSIRAFAEGSLV